MGLLRTCLLSAAVASVGQISIAVAQTLTPPFFPKPSQADDDACRRCLAAGVAPAAPGSDAVLQAAWGTLEQPWPRGRRQ